MKLPLLQHPKVCYNQLMKGHEITKDIEWVGDKDSLEDGSIEILTEQLNKISKKYVQEASDGVLRIKSTESKNKFDNEVARLLHSRLKLNQEQANQDGFWSYLSIIETPDIVESRFGSKTKNRFVCGEKKWKHIYKRLWWRAEIIYDSKNEEDPYHLLERTEEDFWVSLLEREISSCRALVHKLTERLFMEEGEFDMIERRKIIERLRKLWTSYSLETIQKKNMNGFIDYVIESAVNDIN